MNVKDILYDFTKLDEDGFIKKYSNSQDNLVNVLYNLCNIISNDKNSSIVREYATLKECQYTQNTKKLDYDGYNKNNEPVEVKPQNYYTDNPKCKKLNGYGSFNDYTWERYDRDLQNDPEVLFSGFVDGKLLYILSVKYSDIKVFEDRLNKRFPNRIRKKGEFLRSLKIAFNDYKDCNSLIVKYVNKKLLICYSKCINKELYKKLNE